MNFLTKLGISLFTILTFLMLVKTSPAIAVENFKSAEGQFKSVAGQGGAGLDTTTTPEARVGNIIQTALTFIGMVFLILSVYGGFIWMTARGEEAQAKKAKDIITMAAIGMIIIMLAYMATSFIVNAVFAVPTSQL